MSYGEIHEDLKSAHTADLEAIGGTMKRWPVGKGTRFIHLIVDGIVTTIFFYIIGALIGIVGVLIDPDFLYWLQDMPVLLSYLISYSLFFLYYFILESTTGQTIGKMITKTKVIAEDGSVPTQKTIAYRSLARLIPFEAFSFLGSKDTGWHDSISKTYVVKREDL